MPDRIPDRTLGSHLEEIEDGFDRIERRQRVRNRALIGLVVAVAVVGWVRFDRADAARAARTVQSCTGANRSQKDYTDDLVKASGGDPHDPTLAARLAKIRRRDCTKQGIDDYYRHAPKNAPCSADGRVSDGRGYCVERTTTTAAATTTTHPAR
jgi:hypothetical protein